MLLEKGYFNGEDYFEKTIHIYLWFAEKSIGKTTWGFNYGIRLYERKGTSFAWLFNNEKEVNAFKSVELKSLIDLNKYRIKGNTVIDKENEVVVCLLGNAKFPHYLKNYQNITTLFYDEFTRSTDLSHFEAFTNFITAVSNLERKKKGFKIYAFSNTLSMNNAFFTNLDIVIPAYDSKETLIMYKKEMNLKIMILKEGEFFNHQLKSESLANKLAKANTKIATSLFGNQFNLDNNKMIYSVKKDDVPVKKFLYKINYENFVFIIIKLQNGDWYFDYYDKWSEQIILKLPVLNITILDVFMNSRQREELEDNADIFELMESHIYNETIWFNNIEIRERILSFLSNYKLLNRNHKRK